MRCINKTIRIDDIITLHILTNYKISCSLLLRDFKG